jgi:hypothetical protein
MVGGTRLVYFVMLVLPLTASTPRPGRWTHRRFELHVLFDTARLPDPGAHDDLLIGVGSICAPSYS